MINWKVFLVSVLLFMVLIIALISLINPRSPVLNCEAVKAMTSSKGFDRNQSARLHDAVEQAETQCAIDSFAQFSDLDDLIVNDKIVFTVVLGVLFLLLYAIILLWYNFLDVSQVPVVSLLITYNRRATRYEREANIVLIGIFILIIGGSVVFFKAASFAEDDIISLMNISHQISSSKSESESTLSWLPLAFVLAIRLGDVAFTSFLTYMCLRIYRYKLRLAAFYLSRADAFRIATTSSFSKVNLELLPDLLDANLDFGRDQPSLSQHLAEITRAIIPQSKSSPASAPSSPDAHGRSSSDPA